MFNIFPYIFSNTVNILSNNIGLIDNIVDTIINSVVNSEFVENVVSNIENMDSINIKFDEHRNAYTIECYLPRVKKENIEIDYENNYVTLKVKRNMVYSNNQNFTVAIIQSGGDVEEDYYVENIDPYGIKAAFKNDFLRVLIPKNSYIGEETTIIDVNDYIINN